MVELKTKIYEQDSWKAKITKMQEIPLREVLGGRSDAFMNAMRKPDTKKAANWTPSEFEDYKGNRLDRTVLVVTYKIEDQERSDWAFIPTQSGFKKSNLKAVLDKNPDLPDDTEDWVGKEIVIEIGKNGFYQLAK